MKEFTVLYITADNCMGCKITRGTGKISEKGMFSPGNLKRLIKKNVKFQNIHLRSMSAESLDDVIAIGNFHITPENDIKQFYFEPLDNSSGLRYHEITSTGFHSKLTQKRKNWKKFVHASVSKRIFDYVGLIFPFAMIMRTSNYLDTIENPDLTLLALANFGLTERTSNGMYRLYRHPRFDDQRAIDLEELIETVSSGKVLIKCHRHSSDPEPSFERTENSAKPQKPQKLQKLTIPVQKFIPYEDDL